MELFGYLVVALGILAFGLVSARAERSVFTAPMVFVLCGYLVSDAALGVVSFSLDSALIELLAQLALILILFTDASRIDLRSLWREHWLPVRMLGIGLPLTIGCGTVVAAALFPHLSIWLAILLAIVLAPTDAALGQAVVSSPQVPARVRQALNVESGLNDGIVLPFLLIALTCATAASGTEQDIAYWSVFIAKQVLLGPLIGAATGYVGARLLQLAYRNDWITPVFLKLSALGLALLAFSAAELVHGNGFIAAFAAGMVMGNVARDICPRIHEFGEAEGQLLALLVFLIFGGLMVPQSIDSLSWEVCLYALLSLTLVRMLPVAVSVVGKRLKFSSVVFLGWFGPRGIASILYALLIVEKANIPGIETVLTTVMLTVLLSVFLHGVTANPGARAYARALQCDHPDQLMEHEPASEMPTRLRSPVN